MEFVSAHGKKINRHIVYLHPNFSHGLGRICMQWHTISLAYISNIRDWLNNARFVINPLYRDEVDLLRRYLLL